MNRIVEGRYAARRVRAKNCTWCGAKPTQPCMTSTGSPSPEFHAARWDAAGEVQPRAARRRTGKPVGRPLGAFGKQNRTVRCPTCGRPAGQHCATRTGQHTGYHRARVQASGGL